MLYEIKTMYRLEHLHFTFGILILIYEYDTSLGSISVGV